jgi:CheY-like chemotaxis protein
MRRQPAIRREDAGGRPGGRLHGAFIAWIPSRAPAAVSNRLPGHHRPRHVPGAGDRVARAGPAMPALPGQVFRQRAAQAPVCSLQCLFDRTAAGTMMQTESSKRVLVVEDDPVVAMVIEDTLHAMGLEVLVDLNLVDALNEVEASPFDAAMIDVGLRGENAWPVMVALQKRNIPFVVMSGGDLTGLAQEFPQVRMINKPVPVEMLRQIALRVAGVAIGSVAPLNRAGLHASLPAASSPGSSPSIRRRRSASAVTVNGLVISSMPAAKPVVSDTSAA